MVTVRLQLYEHLGEGLKGVMFGISTKTVQCRQWYINDVQKAKSAKKTQNDRVPRTFYIILYPTL